MEEEEEEEEENNNNNNNNKKQQTTEDMTTKAVVSDKVAPHDARPPREREVPGSNPVSAGIFSGSSHTSDLNIGTPVATLPGAWRYRVSTGTGRPGVSIL